MRYLTKEWYLACQTANMTAEAQKKLDEAVRACRTAMEREAVPEELRRGFSFHDGVILEIHSGTDYILRVDCPFSGFHTVVFRGARLRQEQPPVGAIWLYEELYRHKSGSGYEAHILFETPSGPTHKKMRASDLTDLKIICSDIELQP